jgi:hypothetical protein
VYRPTDTYNIAAFCMLVRSTRHATMTDRYRQIGTGDRRVIDISVPRSWYAGTDADSYAHVW